MLVPRRQIQFKLYYKQNQQTMGSRILVESNKYKEEIRTASENIEEMIKFCKLLERNAN